MALGLGFPQGVWCWLLWSMFSWMKDGWGAPAFAVTLKSSCSSRNAPTSWTFFKVRVVFYWDPHVWVSSLVLQPSLIEGWTACLFKSSRTVCLLKQVFSWSFSGLWIFSLSDFLKLHLNCIIDLYIVTLLDLLLVKHTTHWEEEVSPGRAEDI